MNIFQVQVLCLFQAGVACLKSLLHAFVLHQRLYASQNITIVFIRICYDTLGCWSWLFWTNFTSLYVLGFKGFILFRSSMSGVPGPLKSRACHVHSSKDSKQTWNNPLSVTVVFRISYDSPFRVYGRDTAGIYNETGMSQSLYPFAHCLSQVRTFLSLCLCSPCTHWLSQALILQSFLFSLPSHPLPSHSTINFFVSNYESCTYSR